MTVTPELVPITEQTGKPNHLVVAPMGNLGMVRTSGTTEAGKPCTVDLTTVTTLSLEACEVLCASVWRSGAVHIVGGSAVACAALVDHIAVHEALGMAPAWDTER
jgi:hypothetical protein